MLRRSRLCHFRFRVFHSGLGNSEIVRLPFSRSPLSFYRGIKKDLVPFLLRERSILVTPSIDHFAEVQV